MNTALPAASRLCLGAKNSSDAASARPPTRAAARSTRPSFNEATFQFLASETPLAHTRTELEGGFVEGRSTKPPSNSLRRKLPLLIHARSPHETLAHDSFEYH